MTGRTVVLPRRGATLLLVLWLVALLAVTSMAASGAARSSGRVVEVRRAQAIARSMAESGVAAAVSTISDSLRALAGDSVARDGYLNSLDAGVNGGRTALNKLSQDTIGDGAFAVGAIDVSARLDVNEASEENLVRLFSAAGDRDAAQQLARRLVARVRGASLVLSEQQVRAARQDSLVQALLGAPRVGGAFRNPFRSMEQLTALPGFSVAMREKLLPLLTIDGDGRINRTKAPPLVLAAASGSWSSAPSRLLIVSRGWQLGHSLTREIQAVYEVNVTGLSFVRWRERDL